MTLDDERQIADLLAEGMTASEIADSIGKSVRTVNFRLQILFAKYGIPAGKHRSIKLLIALGYIKNKNTP